MYGSRRAWLSLLASIVRPPLLWQAVRQRFGVMRRPQLNAKSLARQTQQRSDRRIVDQSCWLRAFASVVVLTGEVVPQQCGAAFVTPVEHERVTAGAWLAPDFGLLVGLVSPVLPWPAEVF